MRSVWKYREQVYPYLFGALFAGASVYWVNDVTIWAFVQNVNVPAFFAAIFDLAAIMTAFLFAFFGMVMAPTGGFIQKIFGTKTFRLFVRYVTEALVLGGLLSVVSIPLMVKDIFPNVKDVWPLLLVGTWGFLFASSMFAFYRVASLFIIWIRAGSSSFRPKVVPINEGSNRRAA